MSPSALFVTTVPITLEAFLIPFAEHFRREGWRIDALAKDATQHEPIYSVFDNRYDITWNRNPLSPSALFDTWERVRRVVIEGGYDIVHVHTPIASFMTRFALRSLPPGTRPAVIYTTHGFHFYQGQGFAGHAVFRTLERVAARWTDYLVTINEEDFRAAGAFRAIPPERVRYIPGIGVDLERFAEGAVSADATASVRRELDIAPDAFMLTMVAEFAPVKRHEHLLDALALSSARNVVVVFVGSGALEPDVCARVERSGLTSRVRFAGYRRDIPAVLAASDAVTLVSHREGLARSVLEAMAAAKPVIGTATRGISDAVGAEAGWIVDKNDVRALAAAIDAAAADPEEVCRRGRAARSRAQERFSLGRIIDAYDALYLEALSARSATS